MTHCLTFLFTSCISIVNMVDISMQYFHVTDLALKLLNTCSEQFTLVYQTCYLPWMCMIQENSETVSKGVGFFFPFRKGSLKTGKYKRHCLLNNDNLKLGTAMWVRETTSGKGKPNMTATLLHQWVNNDLFPWYHLPPNFLRTITVCTATWWLHKLSFHHKRALMRTAKRGCGWNLVKSFSSN